MIINKKPIESYYTVDPVTNCWNWLKCIDKNTKYGRINIRRINYNAYKVFYELFKGLVPKGKHIDHLCRNRTCVNPDHLEAVSQGENNRRGNATILNEFKVFKIKEKLPYMSHKAIAIEFGVSKSAIDHISSGNNWKDVIL